MRTQVGIRAILSTRTLHAGAPPEFVEYRIHCVEYTAIASGFDAAMAALPRGSWCLCASRRL
jgi:hypothetical protein